MTWPNRILGNPHFLFMGLALVLAGNWNGFNKDDLNAPLNLTRVTAPDLQETPDAYNWLTTTIHVATIGGDTTPGTPQVRVVYSIARSASSESLAVRRSQRAGRDGLPS